MTHSHRPSVPGDTDGPGGDGLPDAGGPLVFDRGLRVAVAVVLLTLLAVTVAGLVLLWPSGSPVADPRLGLGGEQVHATVTAVSTGPCPTGEAADGGVCTTATVVIDDGPDAGEIVVLTQAEGVGSRDLTEGTGVVLARSAGVPLESRYQVVDLQRGPPLLALAAVFALAVVAVGRWRGLSALAGLAATFAVLTLFVLPALLEGRNPLQVAIVGSAAVLVVSLYLAHGVSVRTTVALFGTLVSLALTGVLAALSLAAGQFSGLVSEEALFLSAASVEMDLRGLLLAGIVIGTLGVLDDVTVTQTSAVFELHAAAPGLDRRRLAAGALRIGRDHIASTVNTLVLAYAGAALPLLLLFVLAAQPVGDTLTNEVVAQEVVRTLVGGLGIVASVPLTTWLAVLVVRRARPAGSGEAPAVEPHRDEEQKVPVPGPPAAPDVEDGTAPPVESPRARPAGSPRPGAPQASSRWRRGSRALRAEREAAELLHGLRPSEPTDGEPDGPAGGEPDGPPRD